MTITFRSDFGFLPCLLGIYFEVRDGLNQSANLLGMICEAYTKEHVFRSSGQNMYLKRHGNIHERDFHINYTAKPMNITGFYSFIDPFCKIISLLSTYNRQSKKYKINFLFYSFSNTSPFEGRDKAGCTAQPDLILVVFGRRCPSASYCLAKKRNRCAKQHQCEIQHGDCKKKQRQLQL